METFYGDVRRVFILRLEKRATIDEQLKNTKLNTRASN